MVEVPIKVLIWDAWGPHHGSSPRHPGYLHWGASPGCLGCSAITLLPDAEGLHCGPSLGQDACIPQPQLSLDAHGPWPFSRVPVACCC